MEARSTWQRFVEPDHLGRSHLRDEFFRLRGIQRNPGERTELKRHLSCLNKADGTIRWTKTIDSTETVGGFANFIAHHGYASHSPVTDGKAVYCFFSKEGVRAFDFDGEQLWHFAEVGTSIGSFGSGGALALSGNLLFVNASAESKSFIALDKTSGKRVWQTEGITECYNTPTLFGDVLLAEARDQLIALDPKTGKKKWQIASASSYICNSPTVVDGIAYITHGGRGPTVAIRPDGKEIWSNKRGVTVPSPVVADGLVYIAERDVLTCLEAASGDEIYRERVGVPITDRTYATPLVLGDRLLVVTRKDGAMVFAIGREFKLVSHNKIAGDDSLWNASPAVSDGRLFLRSDQALYCIGK